MVIETNKKALNQHTEYIKLGKWLVDVFVFAIKWAIPLRMQENHDHTAKTPFFALMTSAVFLCFFPFWRSTLQPAPPHDLSWPRWWVLRDVRFRPTSPTHGGSNGNTICFWGNFMYNGHLWWVFPWQMVIFHSFLYVYQRVALVTLRVLWICFSAWKRWRARADFAKRG